MLEGLDRCANVGAVRRAHHDVPVVLVEQRHRAIERCRVARRRNGDGVLFRGRANDLNAAELQRGIVGIFLPQLVELDDIGFGNRRRDGNRSVDPQREIALLADLTRAAPVLPRRCVTECTLVTPSCALRRSPSRSATIFSARVGCGRTRATRSMAASFSTPVGSPVRRSFTTIPIDRIPRPTSDAGFLERLRVRPRDVPSALVTNTGRSWTASSRIFRAATFAVASSSTSPLRPTTQGRDGASSA